MSTTTDLQHARCPRCKTTFTTEDGYHMVDLLDRPPEPDLCNKRSWDLHFNICRECHLDLLAWLYPDAATWEELGEHLRKDAIGAADRLTR